MPKDKDTIRHTHTAGDGTVTVDERKLTDEEQADRDREAVLRGFLENDSPTQADSDEVLRVLAHYALGEG